MMPASAVVRGVSTRVQLARRATVLCMEQHVHWWQSCGKPEE